MFVAHIFFFYRFRANILRKTAELCISEKTAIQLYFVRSEVLHYYMDATFYY